MTSEFGATLAFGFIALLILLMGIKRGIFKMENPPWIVPLNLLQLLGAFGLYFLGNYVFNSIAIHLAKTRVIFDYTAFISWFSFTLYFSIAGILVLYLFFLPKEVRSGIFKSPVQSFFSMKMVISAFYFWIVAFPLVISLSHFLELVLTRIFGKAQLPDQIAVKFLKQTLSHPTFFLSLFSVVILAPFIEEILFRGFLQTFIRKHLDRNQAIFITSFCFSFFHYSISQGVGNIMIIASLFVFALFLSIIYEKEGSLLAPMLLHAGFNAVSALNLYLFNGVLPIT